MTAALALSVVALLATIAVLVLLLTKQRAAKQKISDELRETSARLERYSGIQSIEGEVQRLTTDADHLRNLIKLSEKTKADLVTQVSSLQKDVEQLSLDAHVQDFGLYEPKYQFPDSPSYKQELDRIYDLEKEMIKADRAARCQTTWTVEGSQARGRKMVEQQLKLMLQAFNGETDALISKVRFDNAKRIEERIEKLFEKLNKLGAEKQCFITREFFELKLKELHLTHEYAEKKQQEAEEQRAIREQMREEEKAQRELERAQLEAEREAERYQSALQKAQRDAEKAQGEKLNKLNAEIERLSQLVTDANARKERAISQAQLTKSGYVYIISNVGSFGEEVYKIGMTRRLDPMDRVHELGDASVPFAFDVHAMVYSEDAPGLENLLHRSFDQRRVNLVNTKKEFFRVALDEIREVVTKHHAGEVKYTLVAEALEFRKSQGMRALGQGPIRAPQSGRATARA